MEPIKRQLGIWTVLLNPLDEGRKHIATHLGNIFFFIAMGKQIFFKFVIVDASFPSVAKSILGPARSTNRLTYWLLAVSRGL